MFDPHLLAELRKQRRKAALPPMLFLLVFFVTVVVAVYLQTDPYNYLDWLIVFSLILISIAAVWIFVVEGFLYYIERKSDEIVSFSVHSFAGRTTIRLHTADRLALSFPLDEKQKDEVIGKLKAAFPGKKFNQSSYQLSNEKKKYS